jgi:hypothetical protein
MYIRKRTKFRPPHASYDIPDTEIYIRPVLLYQSTYESVLVFEVLLRLACVALESKSSPVRCILKGFAEANHIPPFFRFSSALAFLADNTSGASVLSGSAVWMNGC